MKKLTSLLPWAFILGLLTQSCGKFQDSCVTDEIRLSLNSNKTIEELAEQTNTLRERTRHLRTGPYSDEVLYANFSTPPDRINPLLVGRNILYSEEWLNHIGNLVSEEEWRTFVERNDRIYDGFAHLHGSLPRRGQRFFVRLDDLQSFYAKAYGLSPNIAFDRRESRLRNMFEFSRRGSYGWIMLHEISHKFDMCVPNRDWSAEAEGMANFKVPFVMEMLNAKVYSTETAQAYHLFHEHAGGGVSDPAFPIEGRDLRFAQIEAAMIAWGRGTNFHTFATAAHNAHSANDLYLNKLGRFAGAEAVKLAFRSYTNPAMKRCLPRVDFNDRTQVGIAREFFERMVHFGQRPEVLDWVSNRELLYSKFNANPRPRQVSPCPCVRGR